MKDLTGPYAGMTNEVLPNYEKTVAAVKAASISHFAFKAQEGKNIPYLTTKQLSEQTGVSVKTYERMRKAGNGPPFKRISARKIIYMIVDLDIWFANNQPPLLAAKDAPVSPSL